MRKIKRIIALVTVALFLLSLAAPAAMAATKEDAFGRLNALSVAVGDATGNPQYDKNFTRAEAAAIMVNLSGMKAAIDAAKGPTKFKDVPASHWASGVINLAVGAGVIKGYPDGTYKPDANVTYAEMSAMLVGVLGYTPKLQGTWPSNVIGKAAQLGLLDGLTVTDYNAAAVRSNVFLASDNALDTKPLIEKKDGFEADTKTLMESKLSVTKKYDAIVNAVPAVTGTKGKIGVDYTLGSTITAPADAGATTLTLGDGIDANDKLGLKVAAWVKDDKVFFLNVKTDASDIVSDTLDGNLTDVNANGIADAGDTIKVKTLAKTYTLDTTGLKTYKNWVDNTGGAGSAAAFADKNAVKLVLNNGKVKYLIATAYTTNMVDKVNTTDEKLTFKSSTPSGSLTLKDLVNTIVKDGKVITLADIKPGNIVDYINVPNVSNYIVVSDGVATGKLTAAASDAKTLTIDGKDVKANGNVYVSTNNGDTYGATAVTTGAGFNAYFGATVKGFLNKDGKVAFMIATQGDASTSIPVLVKNVKRTTGGATDGTYIYVAKFDGTSTNYEVTSDSKVNGTKVTNTAATLKNAGHGGLDANITNGTDNVNRGDIVKISLTSDNKIDSITTYDAANIMNAGGVNAGAYATGFTANKDADTIALGGIAYKVDSNTKLLKVKDYSDENNATTQTFLQNAILGAVDTYVGGIDTLTWTALETAGAQAAGHLGLIQQNGVAQYVVLFSTATPTASNLKYGMFINSASNSSGTTWNMKVEGADMSKIYDNGLTAVGPAKGSLVKFKLNSSDKVDSAALVTDLNNVAAGAYEYFKVKAIDKTNKRLKVIALDANSATANEKGSAFYVDVTDGTKYFSIKDTSAIKVLTIDDLSTDDIVQLYDAFDKNGNDQAAGGFNANELIYDFVLRTNS